MTSTAAPASIQRGPTNTWRAALIAQTDEAVKRALRVFTSVSIDLIYARPGQSPAQWEAELADALSLGAPHRKVSFTVPTGNFGDIFAGYIAKRMGLPIARLIIASNENDILPRTVASGASAGWATVTSAASRQRGCAVCVKRETGAAQTARSRTVIRRRPWS